jgi:hypothetical protein
MMPFNLHIDFELDWFFMCEMFRDMIQSWYEKLTHPIIEFICSIPSWTKARVNYSSNNDPILSRPFTHIDILKLFE